MPRKTKTPLAVLPTISSELLEQFGNGPMTVEAINAATLVLKKALVERALSGCSVASSGATHVPYVQSHSDSLRALIRLLPVD